MDFYSTGGPPEFIPGLVRVADDGHWERWHTTLVVGSEIPRASGPVLYSGEWMPCSELDVIDAIRHRPSEHPTSLTPEELATSRIGE